MTSVAIIPARGGSRGIPRKNLRPIAGKPLLAYTIEHARSTPSIDRVVVSTDDVEIGTVAARYGAEVIWRPGLLTFVGVMMMFTGMGMGLNLGLRR